MVRSSRFECCGLLEGEFEDGGTSADIRVVAADVAGTRLGDQAGKGAAGDGGEGEIDDIGVAEKVVEEGFDGIDGVGASQLK